jgi:hypothetical protein
MAKRSTAADCPLFAQAALTRARKHLRTITVGLRRKLKTADPKRRKLLNLKIKQVTRLYALTDFTFH